MTFGNFKVKQEAGGVRITDRQSAKTFILSLEKRRRDAPHWQRVAEVLKSASQTPEEEATAGEAFKHALQAEGWLE